MSIASSAPRETAEPLVHETAPTAFLSKPAPAVRWALWIFVLGAGLVLSWSERYAFDEDGLSYLDISDGAFRGPASLFVNAYWSPAYPAALALLRPVFSLVTRREIVAVHLVNVVFLGLAWAAFGAVFGALGKVLPGRQTREDSPGAARRNAGSLSFVFLGLVFLWLFARQIGLGRTTPDLLLCGVLLLAFREAVLAVHGQSRWAFPRMGALLGLAYLTKAVVFPVAVFAFLLCGIAFVRRPGRRAAFLSGLLAFAVISGGWIAALSIQKQRLTFGDSGPLNYAWYVNGARNYFHWQGEKQGLGAARHPTRLLLHSPEVFAFGGVFPTTTFPPWFDPSYWNEGLRPRMDLGPGARHAVAQLRSLRRVVFDGSGAVVAACLIALWLLLGSPLSALGNESRGARLAILAVPLFAVALLCLVHLNGRLAGPFLLPLYLYVLALVLARATASDSRSVRAILVAGSVVLGLVFLDFVATTAIAAPPRHGVSVQEEIASRLKREGVKPGTRIAVAGEIVAGEESSLYWARIAGLHVEAHVNAPAETLCRLSDEAFEGVQELLGREGLHTIVYRSGRDEVPPPGCHGARPLGSLASLWNF
jgi:hypothetical protein